jgi:hypothetical protein
MTTTCRQSLRDLAASLFTIDSMRSFIYLLPWMQSQYLHLGWNTVLTNIIRKVDLAHGKCLS